MKTVLFLATSKAQLASFQKIVAKLQIVQVNCFLGIIEDDMRLRIDNVFISNPFVAIERLEPCLLVIGNDSVVAVRPYLDTFKYYGIPTLLIQDGIIGYNANSCKNILRIFNHLKNTAKIIKIYHCWYRTLRKINCHFIGSIYYIVKDVWIKLIKGEIYGTLGCDKVAVFGEYTRDVLLSRGISKESIIITGCPRFDDLFNYKPGHKNIRDCISKHLGINKEKKWVLLITQAFEEDGIWSKGVAEKYVNDICNIISRIDNCELILRPHPREKKEKYERFVSQGLCSDASGFSLYELLYSVDIVLGINSTVLIEAMALKKVVVVTDFFSMGDPYSFKRLGLVLLASEGFSLRENILKIINENNTSILSKQEKFLKLHVGTVDGKSTERVCSLIINMINNTT